MKNIVELRDEMVGVFDQLKTGQIEHKRAKEMSNAAGKIIGSLSLELKYAQQRNQTPDIEFLNVKKETTE